MKKIVSILVLIMAGVVLFGQDIVGTWNGAFAPPGGMGELRIVFHISATDNGYSSTLDSPDQNAFDLPTDTTTYKDKELTIKYGEIDFVYTGKLTGKKEVTGTFTQMGATYDLNLTKKDE